MEEILEKIRELYNTMYLETSELAVDLHRALDIEVLDNANDLKGVFSEDQEKSLNVIATLVWQMMVGALRIEGLESRLDDKSFEAIFDQIRIAHFG